MADSDSSQVLVLEIILAKSFYITSKAGVVRSVHSQPVSLSIHSDNPATNVSIEVWRPASGPRPLHLQPLGLSALENK
jgi:hypothetical protein